MKLLTSTAISLLLISLASVSYGQVRTINYTNGDVYVGEFWDNQPNRQGTYTFANGDVYVGEFRNGFPNGQGTYTFANGRVMSGTWRDNFELIESSTSSGNERIKSLCTSYGFTPNTDAHANCVMNMDMQQSAANNEARRRAAQGLYNLGIQLINGGPNTLRRSSGGNGSAGSGFLLREAVSGQNKICYYSGPSGTFAINQNASMVCAGSANKP